MFALFGKHFGEVKALVTLFILSAVSGLAASDQKIEFMLQKADQILAQTEVVSTSAAGSSGSCPESNWALSLIVAHHPEPIPHLLELAEHSRPAGFVMCLLGVRALDEKRFAEEFTKREKDIADANWKMETVQGCVLFKDTAMSILTRKGAWTKEQIIRDPLPEWWKTVRLFPIMGEFE